MESTNMNYIEQLKQDAERIGHIINGNANLCVAYPILARHGLMERTDNGYKSIDHQVVMRRCRAALDLIHDKLSSGSLLPNVQSEPRSQQKNP